RWKFDPKPLSRLQINVEHVVRRLLYGQLTRFCTMHYLVDIDSPLLCHCRDVWSEAHQSTSPDRLVKCMTRRQTVSQGKLGDFFALHVSRGTGNHNQPFRLRLLHLPKLCRKVVAGPQPKPRESNSKLRRGFVQ